MERMKAMQKAMFGEKEFFVNSIIEDSYAGIKTIAVNFTDDTDFAEVQACFDPASPAYDTAKITPLAIYTQVEVSPATTDETGEAVEAVCEWQLQGKHECYTMPTDISRFNGKIKVMLQKELPVEGRVRELQKQLDDVQITQLESEGIL